MPLKYFKSKLLTDTTYDCIVISGPGNISDEGNLYGLKDFTVRILKGVVSEELQIKDISLIKFKARGFIKGAAIGGGIGFALGALVGAEGLNLGSDGSHGGSFGEAVGVGIILFIPFGLIGGGLGALFASDHLYDFTKKDFEAKRITLTYLMKEYSDK